jgi:hypothetical protein
MHNEQQSHYQALATQDSSPVSTFLALCQGSSDPFSAFAIPITSKVNALITYTLEFYLPAVRRDAPNPRSLLASTDWKDCVSLFSSNLTAYAHLARVAAAMSADCSHSLSRPFPLASQALLLKNAGTQILRAHLARGPIEYGTIYAIFCLLVAEVYWCNCEPAQLHAVMLAELFKSTKSVPPDLELLKHAMYHDSQRAVMSLTKPAFDVEGWVPKTVEPSFKPLLESLPEGISLENMAIGLDESLNSDVKLRKIFIGMRYGLAIFLLGIFRPSYNRGQPLENVNLFACYTVTTSVCKLMNHYLSAEKRMKTCSCPTTQALALIQSYTAIATILYLRMLAGIEVSTVFGSSTIFSAKRILMLKLRELITESESLRLEVEPNIWLWAICCGAYIEQYNSTRDGRQESASSKWFNVKLARHARKLGLPRWEGVRERLLGFLYADLLQPGGERWFEGTVEANPLED